MTASAAKGRIRYTRTEAAEQLSISLRKLDYLRAEGKIIGRIDNGHVFFDDDELRSYAKSCPPEGVE